jgi:hypothetical protein
VFHVKTHRLHERSAKCGPAYFPDAETGHESSFREKIFPAGLFGQKALTDGFGFCNLLKLFWMVLQKTAKGFQPLQSTKAPASLTPCRSLQTANNQHACPVCQQKAPPCKRNGFWAVMHRRF